MSTPIAIPGIAFTMEDLCMTTYRERTGDLGRIVHDPDALLPIHNLTRILPRREVGLTPVSKQIHLCLFAEYQRRLWMGIITAAALDPARPARNHPKG